LSTGYPDLEILVVDNAPAYPGTAAALSERFSGDERVRYLTQPVPGASRARNKGVASARGDVIAFVDDDVVVDRHWLVALIDALDRSPDAACVTGLVIPDSLDSPEQFWFEAFGGFNRGYARRTFDLANDRGDTLLYPYTAGALGGLGNAAFRRSALKSPVAFDETLGPGTPAFGAEDQDSFVSLLRAGGRLVYEPSALVRHSHRDSYAELRWQIFTYGAGMVAGLLHWAMRDRSVARELTGRILAALPAILRGGYRRTALQSASDACPPSLRRLERLGHVYGPVAYARAVRYRRRIDHQASTGAALDAGQRVVRGHRSGRRA
jgi:GT2 family glycosyltransferase